MSRTRREELYELIPSYPKACSKELLAAKSGYIKPPYTEESIRKGVKAMEVDLAWLTLRDPSIVERHFQMQKSTLAALKVYGIAEYSAENAVYISRDYGGAR
jgi:hypothetical protein